MIAQVTHPTRCRVGAGVRFALCAALANVVGCERTATAPPGGDGRTAPTPVTLAPVERRAAIRTITVTGSLVADEDSVLSSKLAGRIASITKDVGDAVAPGELLAQIDQRDFELALDQSRATAAAARAKLGLTEVPDASFDLATLPMVQKARAEAANAEARLSRARELREAGSAFSQQEFADIRTEWEVRKSQAEVELLTAQATLAEARAASAQVAIAQQRLEDTSIRAPRIESRADLLYHVAERLVSTGEFVEQGRPLFRVVATGVMKLRATVPERHAGQVVPGMDARVSVSSALQPLSGRIARVSPAVDPQSRMFMAELELENKNGLLKPGGYAEAAILLRSDEGAVFVPEGAIASFAGVHRVFTTSQGKAVEHRVELGERSDGLVEIVSEFSPEHVIAPAPTGMHDGALVRIEPLPPSTGPDGP